MVEEVDGLCDELLRHGQSEAQQRKVYVVDGDGREQEEQHGEEHGAEQQLVNVVVARVDA